MRNQFDEAVISDRKSKSDEEIKASYEIRFRNSVKTLSSGNFNRKLVYKDSWF